MRDAIGCLLPIFLGHLMFAVFLWKIWTLMKGDEIGLAVGIGYALLFPFICWLSWGLGDTSYPESRYK